MTYQPKFLIICLAVSFGVGACRKTPAPAPSIGFAVDGRAEAFTNGTQLLLTDADGTTIDTLRVRDGRFSYQGRTDSVQQYVVYEMAHEVNLVEFFTEAGTVRIDFSKEPGRSRVGGTTVNDAWQQLSDATTPYYELMQQIEDSLYSGNDLTQEAQWVLMERYSQLYTEINKRVLQSAEDNADNELGYFLVSSYKAEDETVNQRVSQIVEKMAPELRQRPRIQQLEARLAEMKLTETGQRSRDFRLRTPDGQEESLLELAARNRITVVDFWASWCRPCRDEMPAMRQLYADLRERGLGIVGISLDKDSAAWQRAISDLKLEWPQLSDLKGWQSAPVQFYHVDGTGIPYTVVLDSAGTILQKGLRAEKLQQYLEHLLQ